MIPSIKKNSNRRSLLIILILFFIFFIPFQVAKRFYLHDTNFFPKASTQHGYLIQPPLTLSQLPLYDADNHIFNSQKLRGKWILLYVGPNKCSALCIKNLYQLQQIHIATGKDQPRVLRIRLSFKTAKPASLELPGVLHLIIDKQQFANFIAIQPTKMLALSVGAIYLVDPLGNVIMSYPLDANPAGILKDLKHLLGVSQIG
jgi:cytochrome oxidase Cu insertion factor (SCO1/SenC/PrrC family)